MEYGEVLATNDWSLEDTPSDARSFQCELLQSGPTVFSTSATVIEHKQLGPGEFWLSQTSEQTACYVLRTHPAAARGTYG